MKRLAGAALILVVLRMAAVTQEPVKKASIEGTVTRADNGKPIAGAQITLSRIYMAPETPAIPPIQIAPATTDDEGRYEFGNLEPGSYRLIAIPTGYVRQEYSARSVPTGVGSGTPIVLTAGQAISNAAFRLTPTGTIRGRIIDESGQPAIGVPVVAAQYAYDASGVKTLRQIGSGSTDDRGAYRIFGLAPGRYYVAMGNPSVGGNGRGSFGQASCLNWSFTFFPGVRDATQADTVEIKAGGEGFADMKAVRQQMKSIRGRVTDTTGQIIGNAGTRGLSSIRIVLTCSYFNNSASSSNPSNYDPANGTFEIQNVNPGAYKVQAQMQDTQATPVSAVNIQEQLSAQLKRSIAEATVIVDNLDVENVLLTFITPETVPGKLTIEEGDLSALPYNQIRIQFRRLIAGQISNLGTPPMSLPANADGMLQVIGMHPGEYVATISGVPLTYYVKSLQLDGKDFLGKPLVFTASTGSGFAIVLSPKAGEISGMVHDAKMQPAAGAQAVLIPSVPSDSDAMHRRSDLYKSAAVDVNGHFTISGITPGDYKVFAWDGMEPYRYFDPEFLKAYEDKGKSIHIGESAKITVDVQVIAISPE